MIIADRGSIGNSQGHRTGRRGPSEWLSRVESRHSAPVSPCQIRVSRLPPSRSCFPGQDIDATGSPVCSMLLYCAHRRTHMCSLLVSAFTRGWAARDSSLSSAAAPHCCPQVFSSTQVQCRPQPASAAESSPPSRAAGSANTAGSCVAAQCDAGRLPSLAPCDP